MLSSYLSWGAMEIRVQELCVRNHPPFLFRVYPNSESSWLFFFPSVAHSLGKISLQLGHTHTKYYHHLGSMYKYQYWFGFCLFKRFILDYLNIYVKKYSVSASGTWRGHKRASDPCTWGSWGALGRCWVLCKYSVTFNHWAICPALPPPRKLSLWLNA